VRKAELALIVLDKVSLETDLAFIEVVGTSQAVGNPLVAG